MIGDLGPLLTARQASAFPAPPALPSRSRPVLSPGSPIRGWPRRSAPSVRGLKIAENQSPLPQDRIFFSFNFYYNLNARINRLFDSPVNHLKVYREIWGVEKTFDSGRGSVGLVLPLNTISANSTIQGQFNKPGGTSTSLGDLSIFTKYILKIDPATGSLVSAGLLINTPTGPRQFAGTDTSRVSMTRRSSPSSVTSSGTSGSTSTASRRWTPPRRSGT